MFVNEPLAKKIVGYLLGEEFEKFSHWGEATVVTPAEAGV